MKNLGSIDNDCFKPPALALLSSVELVTMVARLTKRLNRYKQNLLLIEANECKFSPLDAAKGKGKALLGIRQIERVLANIVALPAYKEALAAKASERAAAKAAVASERAAVVARQAQIVAAKAAHKAVLAADLEAERKGLPPINIFKDALLKKRLQEL